MSEGLGAAPGTAGAVTAGHLLRQARERQGLHIAALAASIKVVPKKLEMLEADRYEALPDATFTRALAQTVCRALKIDPVPVLGLLPPPLGHRLEHAAEGLNAPFRDRSGALVQREWSSFLARPAFWVTLVILAAALAVFLLPSGLLRLPSPRTAAAPSVVTTSLPPSANPVRPGETPGMPPDAPAEILGTAAAEALPAASASGANPASASASAGDAARLKLR